MLFIYQVILTHDDCINYKCITSNNKPTCFFAVLVLKIKYTLNVFTITTAIQTVYPQLAASL